MVTVGVGMTRHLAAVLLSDRWHVPFDVALEDVVENHVLTSLHLRLCRWSVGWAIRSRTCSALTAVARRPSGVRFRAERCS